jgi:hypothetical protein
MLLVLDNLAGHKIPAFVCWLFAHGIMPLDRPVGGTGLNMAESIQRGLKRRALDGQHPGHSDEIIVSPPGTKSSIRAKAGRCARAAVGPQFVVFKAAIANDGDCTNTG